MWWVTSFHLYFSNIALLYSTCKLIYVNIFVKLSYGYDCRIPFRAWCIWSIWIKDSNISNPCFLKNMDREQPARNFQRYLFYLPPPLSMQIPVINLFCEENGLSNWYQHCAHFFWHSSVMNCNILYIIDSMTKSARCMLYLPCAFLLIDPWMRNKF